MEANIVFFIFLGILCQAKMNELDQDEDFMEDSPLESSNEESDDSLEEDSSSYSSSRKPNPKKSSRDYRRSCKELATFVPDLCSYEKAKERCHKYCNDGKTQPALECGLKTTTKSSKKDDIESTGSKRIVGGVESTEGQWPWMVRLVPEGKNNFCGGAILSRYFILTAAHCFSLQTDVSKWTVYAGDFSRSTKDSEEQTLKVKQWFKHEESFHLIKDIAIVQLETPVKLTDRNKASICLPDDDHTPPNGHKCYVAGWGQQKEDDTKSCPDKLRHVGLRIVPRKECNKEESYGGLISDSMLCAGFKEGLKDHCFNDNGGSLVCNVDDRWYTTGISTYSTGCGRPNKYGMYTNVASFRSWIIEHIIDYSEPF